MPKIFEYLGIIIFFYSNEHEPIHVHARKGEYESKAEFIIHNGEIIEKWINYFVYRKDVEFERINEKIR